MDCTQSKSNYLVTWCAYFTCFRNFKGANYCCLIRTWYVILVSFRTWSIGNLAYLYLQSNVLNIQRGMYLVAWTSNLLENPLVFWCHIMLSLMLSSFMFGEEEKTDIQWYTTAEYRANIMSWKMEVCNLKSISGKFIYDILVIIRGGCLLDGTGLIWVFFIILMCL